MSYSKVAVVEIGSNSSKLLIAERSASGQIIPSFEDTIPCRISNGISTDKQFSLSAETISKIIDVISNFLKIIQEQDVNRVVVVGTEALRKASNTPLLTDMIYQKFGFELKVLSGIEEAEAIALGICSDSNLKNISHFQAFDLGGGSLEVFEVFEKKILAVQSLPIGAVYLTEKFFRNPHLPIRQNEIKNATQFISTMLKERISHSECLTLIGCGGAVVHLKKILGKNLDFKNNSTAEMTSPTIEKLIFEFISVGFEKRKSKFPNIPVERLDIFPAALLTIYEMMKFFGSDSIKHSFRNLRYGIATEPDSIVGSIHSFKQTKL